MPHGIVEQFMHDQSHWLNVERRDHDVVPTEANPRTARSPKLAVDHLKQRNFPPTALGGRVSPQDPDASLDSVGVTRRVIGAAQPNDTVDDREGIFGTMVNLPQQPVLRRLKDLNFAKLSNISICDAKKYISRPSSLSTGLRLSWFQKAEPSFR